MVTVSIFYFEMNSNIYGFSMIGIIYNYILSRVFKNPEGTSGMTKVISKFAENREQLVAQFVKSDI